MKDFLSFFGQFRQRFETTGAIAPSSSGLARSMVRFVKDRDRKSPVRILEIGPGTGPVTAKIVRLLEPHDTFDLVEINDVFAARLRERFVTEPRWQAVAEQSIVHEIPLQDYVADDPYDFVISGLPLNNFPVPLVRELTEAYLRLLKPLGVLSYFEYMYVRPIRRKVTRGSEKERIVGIDDHMADLCGRMRIARDSIWLNLPPAWVQHLQAPIPTEDQDAQE